MSYKNYRQYSNFKGINLLAANGVLRFEDVDTAPTTTSGEMLMYVDNGVLYWDNGSSIVALGAAGGSGGSSWEAMYASDNIINIAGGNGLTVAGAMSNVNDVLTLTNTTEGSGSVLQISNSGTGADIRGTSGTWSISKAGVITAAELVLTSAVSTDVFAVTNNAITANNAFIVSGSGVFSGTGANSFANVTASGLTTGTALSVIANAATTSIGVFTVSATGMTSGSTLLVTGGGANIAAGGKVVEIAMGAAITGAGLSVTTTGVHAGSGTSSVVSIVADSATTGVGLTLTMNGLTTGSGILVTSSGIITTGGNLLTLTGNSATTAAGLFRVNANGLTSGIGAVIASSATAITGAGRLLRVDHTGASSTSGILSEFASAAADETVIVKITASAALALGVALQISGVAVTTGKAIEASDLNALTTGIGLHLASSATAIATTGRMLYSNHTGATSTSGILNEFATSATDETVVVKITTAAMVDGVALKVDGTTGMTTGSLIQASSSTAGAVATNGIISFVASGIYTSTANAGFVNITANATTAGTVLAVNATGLVDGVGIYMPSAEAGLTTGKYLSLGGVLTVAKYGATVITGSALGTAALTLTNGDLVVTSGNATLGGKIIASATETIAAGGTSTALSLTKTCHYIDADAGGDTFTLANGTEGQLMLIVCASATGVATVTPATMKGGTSVTLNAAGDAVFLAYVGAGWSILGGNGYTVV